MGVPGSRVQETPLEPDPEGQVQKGQVQEALAVAPAFDEEEPDDELDDEDESDEPEEPADESDDLSEDLESDFDSDDPPGTPEPERLSVR